MIISVHSRTRKIQILEDSDYCSLCTASCKRSPHLISTSFCRQGFASMIDSDVHILPAWDDYGHDTHLPCVAETMYTNGFNLCWLPTVFMSHRGSVRAARLLWGECTYCNVSDWKHWLAMMCTFLNCSFCTRTHKQEQNQSMQPSIKQ